MNRTQTGWLLCLLLLLALLWPNGILLHTGHAAGTSLLADPAGFAAAWRDVLVQSTPLPAVVLFELTLLALLARPWLWLLLHLPVLLWLPLELFYLRHYGAPTSTHVLAILGETNRDEIRGYLGALLWLMPLAALLWLLALLATLRFFYRSVAPWRHRTRLWVLLVLLPCTAGTLLTYKHLSDVAARDRSAPLACPAGLCSYSPFLYVFVDSYPFGLPLRLYDYASQKTLLARYSAELQKARLSLPREPALADQPETYVVVIGESSRADRWQLYGYSRATTPRLSRRQDLLVFADDVSVTAATRTSVPILLSGASIEDVGAFHFKASWINAFKAAGFHVSWLSTQMPVGIHDTTVGIYAALADDVEFLNPGTYSSLGSYDGVLLDALDKALRAPLRKRLIVLHTLGSHAPYQRRYPDPFAQFQPALDKHDNVGIFDPRFTAELGNAYDNSVLYTDTIIDSAIARLQQQPGISALWYTSDHGQTLPADGCKQSGNGFFAKNNFHVPLLFWGSPQYRAALGHRLDGAQGNLQRPVYAADFHASLLDAFGFDLPPALAAHSYLRKGYSAGQRRITIDGRETRDYDTAFAASACGG